MIEIKCETIEELRQLLSLLGGAGKAEGVVPAAAVNAEQEVPWAEREMPKAEQEMPKAEREAPKEKTVQHSLADVRAVLAQVQKTKGKEVLRSLLDEFGVKAVSKVPEDKLDELYEKAVALNA